MFEIVTHPNKILRKKSVNLKRQEILDMEDKFVQDMIETMLVKDGIGLAAPQIGENIRMIVINGEALGEEQHLVLFNPRITFKSKKTCVSEEGCLSVPGINGEVARPEKVRVKAMNIKGENVQFKAKELLARVLQHEIDHLDGILFIDKMLKND